jgi:signal transduction histidine kinase
MTRPAHDDDPHDRLRRVERLVADEVDGRRLIDGVLEGLGRTAGADAAWLVRFDADGSSSDLGLWSTLELSLPTGTRQALSDELRALREVGQPYRVDLAAGELASTVGAEADRLGITSAVGVPVRLGGQVAALAVVARFGREAFPSGTETRLARFVERVAAALAVGWTRPELQSLADEQAALLRVSQLVARGAGEHELFAAVAAEAAGLVGTGGTSLTRADGPRTLTVLATCGGPAGVGTSLEVPLDDPGPESEVVSTHRPARRDDEPRPVPPRRGEEPGPTSSVSVPILVEGRLWGLLGCVSEGRRLPTGTEDRLQQLAELVAGAIASRQARTEVVQLADEQAALRRVAELVARGASLPDVFAGISVEASRLLAVGAALLRFEPDGHAEVVAAHDGPGEVGLRIPTTDAFIGQMFMPDQASRLPDYRETGFVAAVRDLGLRPGTAVPIMVEGTIWGVLKASPSGAALPPGASHEVVGRVADKLEKFAALAAAAIANAENRAQLTASRARIVAAADEARQRLQRDVHDGAQQRLVQTVLTLKLARIAADRGEPTDDLVAEALGYAERATAELRDLVHGILPASLGRAGLRSGIESLIADLPLAVELDFAAPRLPAGSEITAYFVVAEALTNVVKHAAATRVSVRIGVGGGRVSIEVLDDGRGGADPARGSGLTGLMDRVETAEGELVVTSPPGGGTALRASFPVAALQVRSVPEVPP